MKRKPTELRKHFERRSRNSVMSMEDDYGSSAEFYDHILLYKSRDDIGFYQELAGEAGGKILELGCGTGRILIPLARAGYRVTGLDSSEKMLEICSNKLEDEPSEVRNRISLYSGDMRSFEIDDTFHLVTMPFRSFQHVETAEQQLQCLASVRKHMVPGGILVMDLFNPSMEYIIDRSRREEFGEESPFEMPDGRRVTRKFRNPSVDLATQIMDCEIIYYAEFPDGRVERTVHQFRMRYLFRFEAEHLLERAGFRVLQVYGDYNGNEFGSRWPGELILKAEYPESGGK